jgi:hypothetical protein
MLLAHYRVSVFRSPSIPKWRFVLHVYDAIIGLPGVPDEAVAIVMMPQGYLRACLRLSSRDVLVSVTVGVSVSAYRVDITMLAAVVGTMMKLLYLVPNSVILCVSR